MKNIGLLFSVLILTSQIAWGQLLFEENFNYSAGPLTTVGPTWVNHSGTAEQTDVINTDSDFGKSLSYSGYMSPVGRRVFLTESESEDVSRSLPSSINTGVLYASFLMKAITAPSGTTGGHFFHFYENSSLFGGSVYIRPSGSGFNLGINARTATTAATVWDSNVLNYNQTYLIVVKYEFISGTTNDIASLFINPSLVGGEPVADVSHTNTGSGPDLTSIERIALRQSLAIGVGMGGIEIDGIRVATTWSLAPLPVELTSFSATTIGSTVKLSWNTAAEVNNYGFEVERKTGNLQSTVGNYEKIGFVNGNGNSNSPKSYSYEDKNVSAGKYSYRLKQIDNDGQFEYSKTIEVDLGTPRKFELSQNYPNPFNPITTIRFNLPEAGNVKLTLFNILGQEMKTLVNEFKEAGVHTINFDASDLNSGMYIYKLESGSFVQTRKMTLVK
jgi:hypothetical protein